MYEWKMREIIKLCNDIFAMFSIQYTRLVVSFILSLHSESCVCTDMENMTSYAWQFTEGVVIVKVNVYDLYLIVIPDSNLVGCRLYIKF